MPTITTHFFSEQALLFYRPKRIAITDGYHGCHATIDLYKRSHGDCIQVIDLDDNFQTGDLCWLETPVNPTGEARSVTVDPGGRCCVSDHPNAGI